MPCLSASGSLAKATRNLILQRDEARHRVRARTVHPDLAVVVHRHERERGIDRRIDDRDVQLVEGIDRFPIGLGRPSKWIHTEREVGGTDRLHVHHLFQILDVGQDQVFLVNRRRLDGRGERHSLHLGVAAAQQLVGSTLNPGGDVGVGWTAIGRVVLEAAVFGRIVRGSDDDAVGEVSIAAAVVDEDGPRDDGRRRHTVVTLHDGLDSIRGQHFDRGVLGRSGSGVRILSYIERTVDPFTAAIVADGLRDRQDVSLGERRTER